MHLKATARLKIFSVLATAIAGAISTGGCVSPATAPAVAPLATSVNRQAASITNWNGSENCVAIYQHQEFLLIVTSSTTTGGEISIYDDRLGVAYSGIFSRRNPKPGCQLEGEQWVATYNNLSLILSPEFKALFSAATKEPNALAQAITAGPPYFRFDSVYMGKKSGINSIGYGPPGLNLQAAEDWLRKRSPDRIQLIFADALDAVSRSGH
ncbi:MAG: hypothetical protein JWQ90_775 [Hydrocarboniphaga sp.]|uniref:hypothetical protein n=1 Tax=Hydrocarboniphaga sp. TaxID=2033016 RepID=UPI0026123A61|nr:hypothetical protein [Hydrocarboniphaga sp.]MDB5968325.1 hypothetical protein [Hydrocarboniphaga sp.]